MHFTCAQDFHKGKKASVKQKKLRWVYSGENAIFSNFLLCYIAESSNFVYIYLGKSEPNLKIFQGGGSGIQHGIKTASPKSRDTVPTTVKMIPKSSLSYKIYSLMQLHKKI
jgi:hypothetical protein